MTLKYVPLSKLVPSKDNPRRQLDKKAIAGLAASIQADGVLQNLVVEKAGSVFRIISGSRRFLALKLLKQQGAIDAGYKVPVEIRKLDENDALRIATIENVQRADLEPMDEAEAFAKMLQNGASIDDVSAKTGLSEQTVRRRVALSDLCDEVKAAIRSGQVPLGVAEALTLGTHDQQRSILHDLAEGAELDRDAVRDTLCAQKPSASIAIFPLERYTGTLTRDLFATEDTTYFDDIDQFFFLQKEAVDELAEKHRKKAAWVDVLTSYAAPWWQYDDARKGRRGGVVINFHPSGRVEVKKGLARRKVKEEVVETTKETPDAPKKRPEVSANLIRYVALHKSIAVQAALLRNPRKAREVTTVMLAIAFVHNKRLRLDSHPCITAWDDKQEAPTALTVVNEELSHVGSLLGAHLDVHGRVSFSEDATDAAVELYQTVQKLSDDELDRVRSTLILLSFGQDSIDVLDTEESLFNRVARDLGLSMRQWWTPKADFLELLRRDQLEGVAADSGASIRMGKLNTYTKSELVRMLEQYFARTIDSATELSVDDKKGKEWVPALMTFSSTPRST